MANIIIKSDEQRNNESCVLREFHKDPSHVSAEQREAAEYIARQTENIKKEASK